MRETMESPTRTKQRPAKLSVGAEKLLARLKSGPVALGNVLDLTTDAGELGAWCRELRGAGWPVKREVESAGLVWWWLDQDGEPIDPDHRRRRVLAAVDGFIKTHPRRAVPKTKRIKPGRAAGGSGERRR